MRLSGYQPQYFPRLHYLHRALDSDIFEISDYLQFVRKHAYPLPDGSTKRGKSFQAHSPIKLSQGLFHLSVPTHDELAPINQTQIASSEDWARKHLMSIQTGYSRAPYFRNMYSELEAILKKKYQSLSDLSIKTILWGLHHLVSDEPADVEDLSVESVNDLLSKPHPFRLKKVLLASTTPLPPPAKGGANDWIIAFCHHVGADEYYYGGISHAAYMDPEKFAATGIRTTVQDWRCPPYRQQYMDHGFLPNLSVIDLVMHEDLPSRQRVIQGEEGKVAPQKRILHTSR